MFSLSVILSVEYRQALHFQPGFIAIYTGESTLDGFDSCVISEIIRPRKVYLRQK